MKIIGLDTTTVIAVLALIISLGQIVCGFIKRKMNIKIIVNNVKYTSNNAENTEYILMPTLTIVNNSLAPIIITRINCIYRSKKYECEISKSCIGEHHYPKYPESDIPRTERIFSSEFPLTFTAYEAKKENIKFSVDDMGGIKKGDIIALEIITNKKSKTYHLPCLDTDNNFKYI